MVKTRETSRKKGSKALEACLASSSSSSSSSCSTAAPSDPSPPQKAEVVTLRLTPRTHMIEQLLRLADINFKLQLRMTPQTTVKSIVERVLARWRSHVGDEHRIVTQGLCLHLPPTVDDGQSLPAEWSIHDVVQAYPRCVDGGVTWLVFDGEDDRGPPEVPAPKPSSPIDTTESCIRGIMESTCDSAVIAAAQAVENIPDFGGIPGVVGSVASGSTVADFSPKRRQQRRPVKRGAPDDVDFTADLVDASKESTRREQQSGRKRARVEVEEGRLGRDEDEVDCTMATALRMSHTTHMALLAFQEKQQVK